MDTVGLSSQAALLRHPSPTPDVTPASWRGAEGAPDELTRLGEVGRVPSPPGDEGGRFLSRPHPAHGGEGGAAPC